MRRRSAALLLAVLACMGGCRSGADRGGPAPVPVVSERREPGRGLLDTGAYHLGAGAGKNWWRTQGDGQGGF